MRRTTRAAPDERRPRNTANLSGRLTGVVLALALTASGCASADGIALEDLDLALEVDIQTGHGFQIAVPTHAGRSISVVSAPPGVDAEITAVPEDGYVLLSVAVGQDTPTGDYRLALLVTEDGEQHRLGWPFEVVEPVATTQASEVVGTLVLESPVPGSVFRSGSSLRGTSSASTVEYRLTADEILLTAGSVDVVDGSFSTPVSFTNTCCIEMLLEVFDPSSGMALEIPLTFPEPS